MITKFKVKYFLAYVHDFLEIFYLELTHMYIAIDNSRYLHGALSCGKIYHITYSYYTIYNYSVSYIILFTLPFVLCEVQSAYSEYVCPFIDQRLLGDGGQGFLGLKWEGNQDRKIYNE